MEILRIEISDAVYRELRKRADRAGKPPEDLSREILVQALQESPDGPLTPRAILEQAGLLSELSPRLLERIIPGVTLDEVRTSLTAAGGPSLSELIQQQRGPKG